MIEISISTIHPFILENKYTSLDYDFELLDNKDRKKLTKLFCKFLVIKLKQSLIRYINNHKSFLEFVNYKEFLEYNNLSKYSIINLLLEIIDNIVIKDRGVVYDIGVSEIATFKGTPIYVYDVFKQFEFGNKYMNSKNFSL